MPDPAPRSGTNPQGSSTTYAPLLAQGGTLPQSQPNPATPQSYYNDMFTRLQENERELAEKRQKLFNKRSPQNQATTTSPPPYYSTSPYEGGTSPVQENQDKESSPYLNMFIQLGAPVGYTATHYKQVVELANLWKFLQTSGIGPIPEHLARVQSLYNGLSNVPYLSKIPGFTRLTKYITGATLQGSINTVDKTKSTCQTLSGFYNSWFAGANTAEAAAEAATAVTQVAEVAEVASPAAQATGFMLGKAIPILSGVMAAGSCIIDIGKACKDSSALNIANAGVNTVCTTTGAIVGGILGSALGPGGTFIGACIGAGVGNLVASVIKSAINPDGIVGKALDATGIRPALKTIWGGVKTIWHGVFG